MKEKDLQKKASRMDHPEQYETDNPSLFDSDKSLLNVDSIPMEDLKEEQREEKDKHETKHTSSSEKKYKGMA